jgi:hypothetical protein
MEVATVPLDPARARVYAEGWQSWSVTGVFPVTDPPPSVTWPDSLAIDCQYRRSAPDGVFWNNDPDCLMLRPGVERRADWAAVVRAYGGVRASGDGLDRLDAWGLETTRALLVPSSPNVLS